LGLLPDVSYEQKKLALQVGDVIVFCSDGIHECVGKQKEEFGTGRLESLLSELSTGSARDFAEGILQATDRYVDRGRHDDDRTVVALKVTGEEGPARPATPFRF
ncbi:MAG: PP2C family protein-serine/threonine phosphatase, partial [Terriglobia bacterium]